jgi:hypothetical protein
MRTTSKVGIRLLKSRADHMALQRLSVLSLAVDLRLEPPASLYAIG